MIDRWDTLEWNHMSVEYAKKDFLEKIILLNTLLPIPKLCLTIVLFVIEGFKDRLPWELTFKTSMLGNMTWLSLVHYATTELLPWSVSDYIFLIGKKLFNY